MCNNNYLKESNIKTFKNINIKEQHVNLEGNILILSDRLYFLAVELFSYMQSNSNSNMLKVISSTYDLKSIDYNNIDYLIIVGYLDNKSNYDVVNILRRKNNNLKTVQWAVLDDYIDQLCLKYEINFKFERLKSVNDFMNYLYLLKNQHNSYVNPNIENINNPLSTSTNNNKKTSYMKVLVNYFKIF